MEFIETTPAEIEVNDLVFERGVCIGRVHCVDPVGKGRTLLSFYDDPARGGVLMATPRELGDRWIKGYCPMGCGETLFIGSGGYITCSLLGCPNPTAVADLLDDREHEHIVVLGPTAFSVQHPLRERLNGELFDCGLHRYLTELDGPPRQPGRYRVFGTDPTPTGSSWIFEKIKDPAA